jgi:hypothetical protein
VHSIYRPLEDLPELVAAEQAAAEQLRKKKSETQSEPK